MYHSLRLFSHHISELKGENLNATEYNWKEKDVKFILLGTDLAAAPDHLLEAIYNGSKGYWDWNWWINNHWTSKTFSDDMAFIFFRICLSRAGCIFYGTWLTLPYVQHWIIMTTLGGILDFKIFLILFWFTVLNVLIKEWWGDT